MLVNFYIRPIYTMSQILKTKKYKTENKEEEQEKTEFGIQYS